MTQAQRTSGFYLRRQITIDILILKFNISEGIVICNRGYRLDLSTYGLL